MFRPYYRFKQSGDTKYLFHLPRLTVEQMIKSVVIENKMKDFYTHQCMLLYNQDYIPKLTVL